MYLFALHVTFVITYCKYMVYIMVYMFTTCNSSSNKILNKCDMSMLNVLIQLFTNRPTKDTCQRMGKMEVHLIAQLCLWNTQAPLLNFSVLAKMPSKAKTMQDYNA